MWRRRTGGARPAGQPVEEARAAMVHTSAGRHRCWLHTVTSHSWRNHPSACCASSSLNAWSTPASPLSLPTAGAATLQHPTLCLPSQARREQRHRERGAVRCCCAQAAGQGDRGASQDAGGHWVREWAREWAWACWQACEARLLGLCPAAFVPCLAALYAYPWRRASSAAPRGTLQARPHRGLAPRSALLDHPV